MISDVGDQFDRARFEVRFPFGTVRLEEDQIPIEVQITGWSPFIPGDSDNSSLPVAALEYTLKNTSAETLEGVFSFNTRNSTAIRWKSGPRASSPILPETV